MNQQQLILQVSQETYRLRQIIDSCKTKDQLLNARQLCNNVTIKWINMSNLLSSNIDVSLRIQAASRVLISFLIEKAKYIKQDSLFKHYYYD